MLNESLVEWQSFEIHKSEGLDDFQELDIWSARIQLLHIWISFEFNKKKKRVFYKKNTDSMEKQTENLGGF